MPAEQGDERSYANRYRRMYQRQRLRSWQDVHEVDTKTLRHNQPERSINGQNRDHQPRELDQAICEGSRFPKTGRQKPDR